MYYVWSIQTIDTGNFQVVASTSIYLFTLNLSKALLMSLHK